MKTDEKIVLQKYMANAGVDSRRKCQDLIAEGKVKVNGKIARLGTRVSPKSDIVTVNDKRIELFEVKKFYIMLYKPRGFVTTLSDEYGRKCVAELVKDIPARIYPIGRLDKDSEGLLLMTNDGDFSNRVIHPSEDIWKTYRVTVKCDITEKQLVTLYSVTSVDGKKVEPAKVEVLFQEPNRTVLEISIKEGRNRQIRKICEKAGLNVARLKRTSIGKLKLGMLAPGKWRNLTVKEIDGFSSKTNTSN